MIRPRWQALKPQHGLLSWRRWDQAIAVIAAVNLTWVAIDLTYIPLRNFWLQRNLYPCLLYTSPSPRDRTRSRMPSSA